MEKTEPDLAVDVDADAVEPDPAAASSIAASPLPNRATLRHRKNIPYQLVRLAAINIKMLRVISQSH